MRKRKGKGKKERNIRIEAKNHVNCTLKQDSSTVRAYSRKQGHACGITKKGQENSWKGHNYDFFPLI